LPPTTSEATLQKRALTSDFVHRGEFWGHLRRESRF